MDTATLGQTNITVPALGIGAWSWGDRLFWDYGSSYGKAEVRQAFEGAIAAGATFFDTAEVYGPGTSEELLGEFMKTSDRPVQIATKYGPLPWRFSGSAVSEALTASLKRLQCDRVTLYQVHWPFTFFMSQETLLNTLADEVEKGRIEAIGVSNYDADGMRQAYDILARRGIPLAVNQVRYSLLSRQIEAENILATAKELGITLLAYSPLSQGLLTDKYRGDKTPQGARKLDRRFRDSGLKDIEPVLSIVRELAQKYSKTPAQVSLNWLMCQGNVIPIPGAKNDRQARENAGAMGWRLSAEEVNRFAELKIKN